MNTRDEKSLLRFRLSTATVQFDGAESFKRMNEAFNLALTANPAALRKFVCSFGGQATHIRILGHNPAKCIEQPFRHLLLEKGELAKPTLTIDLWDASETGTPCPVDLVDLTLRSTFEHGFVIGSSEDRFIGCQCPQTITWFDRETNHVVGCVLNSRQLSVCERGKPLHFPLLLWHSDRGTPIVHAGLVSYGGQGVLFAGQGGVGKSTSALACVAAGFDYLGDDYIALKVEKNGSVAGYSVYNSAWLAPDHLLRFPFLAPHVIQGEKKKLPVLLSQVIPGKLASTVPISVVLLPSIKDQPAACTVPASKRQAFFALTPSSMIKLPVSGTQSLDMIGRLVDQVPTYWLQLGRDIETVPQRVKTLLKEICTSSNL
jgi:hypothetical protein